MLKGWKETQSPGRVRVDEFSDGRGVIFMGAAREGGFLQEECREAEGVFPAPNF